MAKRAEGAGAAPARESAPGRLPLDPVDLQIVRALQANARTTLTEIGKLVKLSAPAVHDRVRRLEQRGVIRGYRAEVDPEAVGLEVLSLVSVLPTHSASNAKLEAAFAGIDQIEAAFNVTGEESHVLLVRTRTIHELSEVLQHIRDIEGVARTRTNVVLSTPFQRGPAL